MMNTESLIPFLNVLLPSLVAIFTVFLTNYFNTIFDKRKTMQHRIDAVYKPFYLAYFKFNTDFANWQECDIVIRISEINNIYLENIDCVGTDTQKLIINLASELSFFSPGEGTKEIESCFKNLTKNMFKEYSQICCKLKYPKPLQPF